MRTSTSSCRAMIASESRSPQGTTCVAVPHKRHGVLLRPRSLKEEGMGQDSGWNGQRRGKRRNDHLVAVAEAEAELPNCDDLWDDEE